MRLRTTRPSPLLLLLLPAFASALGRRQILGDDAAAAAAVGSNNDYATRALDLDATLTGSIFAAATVKPVLGTKDAPVDGQDGKPHAGPFVDTTPSTSVDVDTAAGNTKKLPAAVEDLDKPLPTSLQKLKNELGSEDALANIPEKNDGVMNDPNRSAPKKGTTGTEGGVSERTRKESTLSESLEKKVESPKDAVLLAHDTQAAAAAAVAAADRKDLETITDKTDDRTITLTGKPKGAQGLEKPTNLPDKPHDMPAPNPKAIPDPDAKLPGANSLKSTLPYTEGLPPNSPAAQGTLDQDETLIQPLHSFILSFTMILFSEIGDKTFLVAVVMAMRHPRMLVFSAALSALFAMTVLSALLGHAAPTLLPKEFTAFLAAVLFLVFGAKMLREGFAMDPELGVNDEMKEVEGEIDEKEHEDRKVGGRRKSSISVYALEAGRGRRAAGGPKPLASPPSSDDERSPSPSRRGAKAGMREALAGFGNLVGLLLSPAWVNTFVMTFTGEWGDRSQIATIAMAAGVDYWWVIAGAVTGHAICTGLAVIAGSLLAGRIRLRIVTLGGAAAFLVFGVIYLFEAIYD